MKMTKQEDENLVQEQQNYDYTKINTTLLLYLYQIFIFLLGHLHFFLHFFFTFMENLFKKHPIFLGATKHLYERVCLSIRPPVRQ